MAEATRSKPVNATSMTLAPREITRIGAPVRLCAQSGVLWVTADGDPKDVLIAAGECQDFEQRRSLLVCALGGEARLSVIGGAREQRRARRFGLRWLAWLRGQRAALGGRA